MLLRLLNKKDEDGYCVLYKEGKGYYLSKIEIATEMNLNPVRKGSKKECEVYIKNNNPTVESRLMF